MQSMRKKERSDRSAHLKPRSDGYVQSNKMFTDLVFEGFKISPKH